jgi:hypothetical protein
METLLAYSHSPKRTKATALEAFFVCTGPAPAGEPVLPSRTVTAAVAAATYKSTVLSSQLSSMPLPLPLLRVRFGGEEGGPLKEPDPGSWGAGKAEKARAAMGDLKSKARSRLMKVPHVRSKMDTYRE